MYNVGFVRRAGKTNDTGEVECCRFRSGCVVHKQRGMDNMVL